MENISKSRSSSPDHADRLRFGEARDYSSDTPSQSAHKPNLTRRWSEQASTSRASDSDQEKQPLLHEKQDLKEKAQPKDALLNNIKTDIIERYKNRAGTTRQTLRTVHNKIGEACLKNGQYEEALFSYEIARALDSETGCKGYDACLTAATRAHEARHQSEKQGIQQEEALLSSIEQITVEGYRKYLKSDEDAEEIKGVLNKIGGEHRGNRQYKEALFFYNAALALKKNSKTALQGRGAIYREQGRFDEALTDLNTAIKQFILRPSTFALANRGATLLGLGRLDEASADLKKVLERDPNNALALETLKKLLQQKEGRT
jgi:tetratricopeptide (TPR) repeat protein